jgi:hypothetical protein
MNEQSVEQRLDRIRRGLNPQHSSDQRPTDNDMAWVVKRLAAAWERERVLVAVLAGIWESKEGWDYLEGKDTDYGPVALAHRRAWQAVEAALRAVGALEEPHGS